MSSWLRVLMIVLFIAGMTGCGLRRPRFADPGDLRSQQTNAILHDPYADEDLGPGLEGGVRPREYEKPQAEAVRNRNFRESRLPF